MNAPVMVFTYSRPEHTRKVLEALAGNTLARVTDVYAYTCKPRDEKHEESVNATKSILYEFESSGMFASFTVVDKSEFRPLGPAMVEAVTEVIEKHNRIIVIEDDIVTSPYYLEFMNQCLEYYEKCGYVFSISGYSPNLDYLDRVNGDVYLVHRACPWGWGTWKDRWEKYSWDVSDYKKSMKDRDLRKKLYRWNTDLPMTLDALFYEKGCMDKNWEQQFCYCQCMSNMSVVCPKKSLVENIGFDGSGTHEVPTGLGDTFDPEINEWKLTPLTIDKKLQRKYNRLFVFRTKTKVLLFISNIVFSISPNLYYGLLEKYYK